MPPRKPVKNTAVCLDLTPRLCYYDSTSFAGLFFMPFFGGSP
ncbi:hypothetical protein SUBVAR_05289 [Subdoligranulum variabile DSM 15176]|uniref:Uncharacterized protein n=1 Tax=Subdoligranulum variabile DSM 15176 TaxID=411471 RepID=D1PLS2_9FIRM|nr:hypothetical protein SUBVAR_05289 [Subdoligranulum variabile DSM 15176]